MADREKLAAALAWQIAAGADEAIGERPLDRYAAAAPKPPPPATVEAPVTPPPAPAPAPPPAPPAETDSDARALADAANTLDELRAALMSFEGCALKHTATNLVFADGNPEARLMVLGEAPGADEDRRGLPFVGVSGQLLDRMLGAIGLDRTKFLISNILYWRPPGNRNPTPVEIAACLPFVERMIELVDPKILVLVGGAAAKSMLNRSEGIMKLRGRWFNYATPNMSHKVATFATFHPAYLLRSPGQKREAWRDLLAIQAKLEEV